MIARKWEPAPAIKPPRLCRSGAVIIVLALAARLAMVLVLHTERTPGLTYEHGEIARNILAGKGFSIRFLGAEGPTSQQAPVYPSLLAGIYWLLGPETPRALVAMQVVQAAWGAATVGIVMLLAQAIWPDRPRVARFAGLLAAVDPTLLYMVTHIQVVSLATLLLALALWLAYQVAGRNRWSDAGLCGSVGALLILTDPILGLVLVPAVAMVLGATIRVIPRPSLGRRCGLAAVLLATTTLGVTPWIVRNWRVHGELVPVKSTFGYAFWQGNNPYSWGTDKIPKRSIDRTIGRANGWAGLDRMLWSARRHDVLYIDDAILARDDVDRLARLSEPARSRVLFARAVGSIRREPGRYMALCLQRFRYFWLFDDTNPKTHNFLYRATQAGLLVLSILGLGRAAPRWRMLWPTVAIAGLVSGFHALTIVSARFHIPIEPLQILWAGGICGRNHQPGGRLRDDAAPTGIGSPNHPWTAT